MIGVLSCFLRDLRAARARRLCLAFCGMTFFHIPYALPSVARMVRSVYAFGMIFQSDTARSDGFLSQRLRSIFCNFLYASCNPLLVTRIGSPVRALRFRDHRSDANAPGPFGSLFFAGARENTVDSPQSSSRGFFFLIPPAPCPLLET